MLKANKNWPRHSPQRSPKHAQETKKGLHPRNPHRARYDFPALIKSMPSLNLYVQTNPFGDLSVDFANPEAVKTLNKALLNHFYQVTIWDIPKGYLCPPIPGRVDYLHYIADLLAGTHYGATPKGRRVRGLDIGMGANCIYPMLGHRVYGWRFVGADIDPIAIKSAKFLVDANPTLKGGIECRWQKNEEDIFVGMINGNENFDFTMCNPPFHASMDEATKGAERKLKNLAINTKKKGSDAISSFGKQRPVNMKENVKPALNFGGQNAELWCLGGEAAFIKRMISQSVHFGSQCLWFTTMVSKKENLPAIYQALKAIKAKEVRTINMAQGQKITRVVAWTFLDPSARDEWCKKWI